MNTNAYATSQRRRYLDREISHQEYWGIVAELIGEGKLRSALPLSHDGSRRTPEQWRQLIQRDEHLNNVPLEEWDMPHSIVRGWVTNVDCDKLIAVTGGTVWPLSDTVCVLKTVARRYANT